MRKENENKVKYGTISLPIPLINKVKDKIKGTGMSSVSAYVSFVLRQVLSSEDKDVVIGKEEEEAIKNRLKSLGYD